jgi:hypothetical protein
MFKDSRRSSGVTFALSALLALAAACSISPNVPNGRVLCDPNAPKCPSGTMCEQVNSASVTIGVCCRVPGCTDGLTPDQVGGIVDAAVNSGNFDASPHDTAGCSMAETCDTNPNAPCKVGRIVCGADGKSCEDGIAARDGTACGSNMLCFSGTCSACMAGVACQTNSDQCRNGITVCDPVGCMNSTAKNPGASCGTGQVCSAAGTCIPCATGANCTTNTGYPCKKGAIVCGTGAPQCLDDVSAPDGTSCGTDKVCKTGTCMSCAGGTVCTTNPGGACKLGVVSCGMTGSGCVDGENAALPRLRQHRGGNELRHQPGVQRQRHLRRVHRRDGLHHQPVGLPERRHLVHDGRVGLRRRHAQVGVDPLPRRSAVRRQRLLRRLRGEPDLHRQSQPVQGRQDDLRRQHDDLHRRRERRGRDQLWRRHGVRRQRRLRRLQRGTAVHHQRQRVQERRHLVRDRRPDLRRRNQQGGRHQLRHQHGV